ncbi:MAG: hypothetical protein ABWX57_07285 [Aeromicrobium sp.]
MRPVRSTACVLLVTLVLAAGCSGESDAKGSARALEDSRSAVAQEVRDAVKALSYVGLDASSLSGGFTTCGSKGSGAASVKYAAGGRVEGGDGTLEERIAGAARLLTASGWTIRRQGETASGGAYSRLTRSGIELSLDRDRLAGSDAFVLGASGDCIEVTDEQADNLPDDDRIVP